jgi:hypothetical protein
MKLCGKGQGKWQCPFCNSKYCRKNDLIRLHIAEQSVEVLQGKAEPISVAGSRATSLGYNQEDLDEFTKAIQPYLGVEVQNSPSQSTAGKMIEDVYILPKNILSAQLRSCKGRQSPPGERPL